MLCGLALLPNQELQQRLIDFQSKYESLLTGPRLGLTQNLPHVSIFQSQLNPHELKESDLSEVLSNTFDDFSNPFETTLTCAAYQPEYWAFANVVKYDWMVALQRSSVRLLNDRILREDIDLHKDFGGYSKQQVAYFAHFGYRYIEEEYSPHFTIGRTNRVPFLEPVIQEAFSQELAGTAVQFTKLAFYEAGPSGSFARAIHSIDIA